jgi:hypothetical protein
MAHVHPLCRWQRAPKAEKGIIVGCDLHQEWLLEWWWNLYSSKNTFPVTFADFGMSEHAKKWCASHGELISVDIDTSFVKSSSEVSFIRREKWEALYGSSFWVLRHSWFKKPFACLLSPYEITIWIDLDCEILTKLDDLFTSCMGSSQLALVREYGVNHLPRWDPEVIYNGGVLVFVHGCDIVMQWAQGCLERSDEFWGDDPLLSKLIAEHRLDVAELPLEYNWKFHWGINMNAHILHWMGKQGKDFIKSHGGLKQSMQKLIQDEK